MSDTTHEFNPAGRGNGSDPELSVSSTTSIFDNLQALRLDPAASLAGAVEHLGHVPVRKPNKMEFFRTHPDPSMSLAASVFNDDEDRETYFVAPSARPILLGYLKPVLLTTSVSRQGVIFLWPVPLPNDAGGGSRAWGETARQGAELARECWIRMQADLALGAYRIYKAEGVLPDPIWPERGFAELLKIAFQRSNHQRFQSSGRPQTTWPFLTGPAALMFQAFREIWAVDFEFNGADGERPRPLCMVAQEYYSRREVRLWRDDLVKLHAAPFDTGLDTLFVAFFASAELSCFLALDWPPLVNILDLFAEHRVATNGLELVFGNSLIGAAALRGVISIDGAQKDAMRSLVMERDAWSASETESILDYCAADVTATIQLLERMAPTIDWPRALLRGRYMLARSLHC
jgi:hypothetical protein